MEPDKLRYFLQGSTSMAVSRPNPSGRKKWLPEAAWKNVLGLAEAFPDLREILGFFTAHLSRFQDVISAAEPMPLLRKLLAEEYGEAAGGVDGGDGDRDGAVSPPPPAAAAASAAASAAAAASSSSASAAAGAGAPVGGGAAAAGAASAGGDGGGGGGGDSVDMAMPGDGATVYAHPWQDPFAHLMLLRCLREDKVVPAVQEYIAAKMGRRFILSPPMDLGTSYKDSTCCVPIVFVLSMGSAPMEMLLQIAEEKKMGGKKLFSVSLGQGQGPIAAAGIQEAVDKGTWVCLQNCHLSASWMPALEAICEGITPETTHPAFRLWLTSMPDKVFPVSILQNAVKITVEPPMGMRANLQGTYLSSMTDDWFEANAQPLTLRRMAYVVCGAVKGRGRPTTGDPTTMTMTGPRLQGSGCTPARTPTPRQGGGDGRLVLRGLVLQRLLTVVACLPA